MFAGQLFDLVRPGDQHVAIRQYKSVPRCRSAGVPFFFPRLVNDAGERGAGNEEGMPDVVVGPQSRRVCGQQCGANRSEVERTATVQQRLLERMSGRLTAGTASR